MSFLEFLSSFMVLPAHFHEQYICRLSKDSVLFFVTIDNEDNAKIIFETMLAWREQQNLDLIDSLVLDGEIEWHKNFLNS